MILSSGETILKFSDYPFMYTIVAIFLKTVSVDFNDHQLLYLGVAGALGTLLTIVDPLGKVVESTLINGFKPKITEIRGFENSAVKTRSMKIEIDKIVGMCYFVFIVFGFAIALMLPFHFIDGLAFTNSDVISCNDHCIRMLGLLGSGIIITILGVTFVKIWTEMDEKLETTAIYQYVIGNDNALINSVDNMTRSMEVNDWSTAKKWGEKIIGEIKLKKGKRELIINSADKIFTPLSEESNAIEKQIIHFKVVRRYSTLPNGRWLGIVNTSQHFMIEDAKLRERIHNFYKKIDDFNELTQTVFDSFTIMVNSIFSSQYNKKISEITINLYDGRNHVGYPILDCAMFDIYPTTLMKNSNVNGIGVKIKEDNGNEHTDGLNFNSPSEFDELWNNIKKNIEQDEQFRKLKQLLQDVDIENRKLRIIYSDMIKWQWDV